jgi:hypothetical protein
VLNPSFGKTIPRPTVNSLEQFLRRWEMPTFVNKVLLQATKRKTKTKECKKNANMLSKTM